MVIGTNIHSRNKSIHELYKKGSRIQKNIMTLEFLSMVQTYVLEFIKPGLLAYLILSYLTILVVLSNARDTKFVVGNFFESSYFTVHTKESICDFPNWRIKMKPLFLSLSGPFCIIGMNSNIIGIPFPSIVGRIFHRNKSTASRVSHYFLFAKAIF